MSDRLPDGPVAGSQAPVIPSVVAGPALPPAPAAGDHPHDWYQSWVRQIPEAPAVDWDAGSWTYRNLDEAAGIVATALEPVAGPGDIVAVCLDRSPALVAAAVAIARLGAVYLPLGAHPPGARVAALANTLPITCLVTADGNLPAIPGDGTSRQVRLPYLSHSCLITYSRVRIEVSPDTLQLCRRAAYAMLTSGSTGIPKAVGVSPEALANLLRWFGPEYAIGPGTRQSLLIQPSFDPHLLELWATLAFGATLCVPDRDVPQSIGETIDWWRTRRTTHAILPTPVAELLLDLEWPADLTLRHLFIGGDKLRSRPRWPAPAMHNHYGPAEGTILSTTQPLATYLTDGPPPIGTPIGGVCVGVIGTDGQLLNRGQTGELILGGSNLALGYLSQPDLTTERFIAAPPEFGDHGERVYRTGDKVRMRVNGVLEFLGRLDDQVKISGVRVEPAEVEAALEYAPDVRQAVVVADEAPDRSQLIAFIRPVPGTDPLDVPQLQQLCREWVPEQAVPAEIRIVNDFPRTANGKVDRQSLVHSCRPPTTPTPQHPQDTGVTSLLLGICERILGITGLRPTDNFFELGGNSLASMQLAAAIESTYGVRLKVPHMLRQPNLASMAQYIHESRGKPATNNNAPNSGRSPTLEE